MSRILLISHICPPAIDGGSRVIFKVGEYFKTKGHTTAALSSNASSTDDFTHPYTSVPVNNRSSELSHPLPVYTFLHRPLKLISKLFPFFSIFSKGPIFKLLPFLKFLVFYLRFKPDYIIAGPLPTTIVLYAHFFKLVSKLFALNTKLLINASFHPTDKDFHHPLLVKSLKSADFIWTLTDFETKYFHHNFSIPLPKMINVGNGIDKSLLSNAPAHHRTKELNLLFIGSFAAHKGIETLIDAFVILSNSQEYQRSNSPNLTLAGQPTLYSRIIETKISSLPKKIHSHIKITSSFQTSELAHLLDQSSILISPSTQESFGLVLLESMSRGVPVVGANIPATAELIEKSGSGFTFKSGDSNDLANKIMLLSKSKDLKLYRSKAISYASAHTWDKIGEAIWQKISLS